MSETERRPGAAETPAAAADDARFTLLTTARDNAEGAFIESVLRGENIPYITRPHSRESWNRVMMGFDLGGIDFFVPEDILDDAAALLAPADDAEECADTDDGENE